ncbi:rhomboid family intramembrane serine protease [Leucobacter ruminantium]|uniref:Rhomboid family intramembrane serine protease n=1 Tax=Leucobacter ruminantium TaxID=1289170 RepID=A0A939RZ78_9MICO|nr:rhomboid family intramembrane serine protease [Leucobacter ruminantium]
MANGPAYGERVEYGPDDVCYRHPRTHSFTLCQRCGRTICADCQVVSSVGVLCPECVKQTQPGAAQRAARSARVSGRRLAALDTPVTYGIIAVNLVVFAAQLVGRYFLADDVTRALWYAPLYSLPGSLLPGDLGFEPWRMLTAMFTHSTGFIFHILFNMYALWLFGRNLEQMIGRAQFLVLYLFAGLGGSLAVMLWVYADPTTVNVPTVGASGAIFGVLAATLVAFRAARANVTSLAVLIGVNFAIGLIPGASISWQAHLGGMVVGALTMWLLLASRGPRHRGRRVASLVGLGAVLVALAFSYFLVLPGIFG